MPRMSKKRKHELSFYLNDRGRVTYNELCRKCQHGCRQSFRAVVVDCPRYLYRTIGSALAGGYRAAVYCRLSKDDDLQGESASIANQRDMLLSLIHI